MTGSTAESAHVWAQQSLGMGHVTHKLKQSAQAEYAAFVALLAGQLHVCSSLFSAMLGISSCCSCMAALRVLTEAKLETV